MSNGLLTLSPGLRPICLNNRVKKWKLGTFIQLIGGCCPPVTEVPNSRGASEQFVTESLGMSQKLSTPRLGGLVVVTRRH